MSQQPKFRLGLISDTHGSLSQTRKALDILQQEGPLDLLIHLGDVCYHGPRNPLPVDYQPMEVAKLLREISEDKVLFVRGNCDNAADEKACGHELFHIERTIDTPFGKLLLEHGDLRDPDQRVQAAKMAGAHFSITGHTHVKQCEKLDTVLCINPGSPTLPKDGSPSCAILTDGSVRFLHIETGEVIASYAFMD